MIATTADHVNPPTLYSVDLSKLPWWEQILAKGGIAVEGGEYEAAIWAAEEAAWLRGEAM